jgi:DNA helicase II / ATP-dependent DNA helicase PcrA
MAEDLLVKLNEQQKEAVTHVQGPLMIVAGAGTGKTTVVTHRIAWLIDQGHAKPEQILALTFTDKAAGEMEERVDRLLPYGYVDLQISTFHSFAEKLLRQYGAELGLSRDFKLMTELDAWLLTRQHFDRFELDYYRPLGNPTKYVRSLLTHFSRAKDVGIDPDDYSKFVEDKKADLDSAQADDAATSEITKLEELAKAYATYQSVLLEHDSLDFGDLMLYTLKLLRTRPSVRNEIRSRFKFVLVDEFQDTNDAQYEIVKAIAGPRNNLTVVGDDDQSIYKFRGASLANILRFEEDYPDARRVVLTTNYRSAQDILDRAHTFIQHNNPNRLEAVEGRNLSKKLTAGVELAAQVEHVHALTASEEVAQVVQRIVALREKQEDTDWSDFAILVRSNAAGIDFAVALERHKIPYQFLALSGLYTKPAVMDLLAYLRIIDNPFDSPSVYRLLTSPLCTISERSILELNQWARKKGRSLFEACEQAGTIEEVSSEDYQGIQQLLKQLTEFQRHALTRPVGELFVMLAKDSGYLEYLNRLSEQKKLDSFSYLQQFYQRLKSFEKRHEHPVLHNFLAEFAHERDAGEEGSLSVDLEAGPDVVRIMTIHAAKGLEFKYVFVVNLVAQRFPTNAKREAIPLPEELGSGSHDKDAHLEEERRLFYVAMTRAKQGLYFMSAEDYGGARKRKISRFLHELGYDSPQPSGEIIKLFDEDQGPDQSDQEQAITYPIPKQFSFTQLAAFKTCPLQYKFAHVLKIPIMGRWTFSYGKTMHNTLQRFFVLWLERVVSQQGSLFNSQEASMGVRGIPVTLDELLETYRACWQDEWYVNDGQRETYRKQGLSSLKDFYRQIPLSRPDPIAVELPFKMKFGDVILKGRIDRIDRIEDGIEIIDYKTGNPKDTLSKDDKEQLLLYQLAARDVLGLVPKKLTYHYLTDNSQVSFIGTNEQLLDLQESIVERAQGIRSSMFDATPGFHCRFCDFADICEFRVSS